MERTEPNTGIVLYSHFELLTAIEDPLKRAFYEIECIRGNWSVLALKRQISSLYFERSGLSLDKDKLSAMANGQAEPNAPQLSIRDLIGFHLRRLVVRFTDLSHQPLRLSGFARDLFDSSGLRNSRAKG